MKEKSLTLISMIIIMILLIIIIIMKNNYIEQLNFDRLLQRQNNTCESNRFDVNKDGIVNSKDYIEVKNYIMAEGVK